MKTPKMPTKPYPPYKPLPPSQQIEDDSKIGSFEVDKYSFYTLESLADAIKNHTADGVDPKNVRIEFKIEQTNTYYDEVIVTLVAEIFNNGLIDNPKYSELYKVYLDRLEIYKKEYKQYKDKLKQYKKDHATYEIEYNKYMLEFSKNKVKQFEKKLKDNVK